MADVDKLFDDIVERDLFVELVADDVTELNAGLEVGWTPRQTRRNIADPMFAEIIQAARDRADGTIEKTLFEVAKRGNMGAIQMWLYNRQPDRWKDVKRIEVRGEHQVSVTAVHAVKEGLLAVLRQGGPEQLQIGGPLDIQDAEVVEGDTDPPAA